MPVISRPISAASPSPESGASRAARSAARPSARPDTIVSRQPMFPQSHRMPCGSTIVWPNSPAPPFTPRTSCPPMTIAPPMPVPRVSITASSTPAAAPARCSASSAAFASLSTHTGTPRRSAMTSRNRTPRSGRCTVLCTTPVVGSTSEGTPKPTPAIGTSDASIASRTAPTIVSRTSASSAPRARRWAR